MKKSERFSYQRPSTGVHILAILGYTGFAIPVSIVAISEFGFLGLVLAAFIAWQWINVINLGGNASVDEIVDKLRPSVEESTAKPTGNASFDAYKAELMERLEKEQTNFEGFLTRLRDAKDKTEFDTFMADRELAARNRSEALTS